MNTFEQQAEKRMDELEHSYELYLESRYLDQQPLDRSKSHGPDEDRCIWISSIHPGQRDAHVYMDIYTKGGTMTSCIYMRPDELEALAFDLVRAARYIRKHAAQ